MLKLGIVVLFLTNLLILNLMPAKSVLKVVPRATKDYTRLVIHKKNKNWWNISLLIRLIGTVQLRDHNHHRIHKYRLTH